MSKSFAGGAQVRQRLRVPEVREMALTHERLRSKSIEDSKHFSMLFKFDSEKYRGIPPVVCTRLWGGYSASTFERRAHEAYRFQASSSESESG